MKAFNYKTLEFKIGERNYKFRRERNGECPHCNLEGKFGVKNLVFFGLRFATDGNMTRDIREDFYNERENYGEFLAALYRCRECGRLVELYKTENWGRKFLNRF